MRPTVADNAAIDGRKGRYSMALLTAAQRTEIETAKGSLITAIATHIAGAPFVASYSVGNRSKTISSIEEAIAGVERLQDLLDADSTGDRAQMVSYGRHRRFR